MTKPDTDPSTKKPYTRLRNKVLAGVAVIGLAGATIAGEHLLDSSGSSRPSAPNSEQDPAEALKAHVEETAQQFATRIMDNANSGGKDKTVSIKQGQASDNLGKSVSYTDYTIQTSADLLVGDGDFGQYTTTARILNDEHGKPDLANVSSIMVTMDIRQKSEDITSYGHFYSFSILHLSAEDEWHVVSRAATKGDPDERAHFYVTEDIGNNPNVQPLTLRDLNILAWQAATVMDWSENASPVNYAPSPKPTAPLPENTPIEFTPPTEPQLP